MSERLQAMFRELESTHQCVLYAPHCLGSTVLFRPYIIVSMSDDEYITRVVFTEVQTDDQHGLTYTIPKHMLDGALSAGIHYIAYDDPQHLQCIHNVLRDVWESYLDQQRIRRGGYHHAQSVTPPITPP